MHFLLLAFVGDDDDDDPNSSSLKLKENLKSRCESINKQCLNPVTKKPHRRSSEAYSRKFVDRRQVGHYLQLGICSTVKSTDHNDTVRHSNEFLVTVSFSHFSENWNPLLTSAPPIALQLF